MSRKPTKKDQEFFEAQRRYQCWLHEPPVPVPRETLERVCVTAQRKEGT